MTELFKKPSKIESLKDLGKNLVNAGKAIAKDAKREITSKVVEIQTKQTETKLKKAELQKTEVAVKTVQQTGEVENIISQSEQKLAELKSKQTILTDEVTTTTSPVNLKKEEIIVPAETATVSQTKTDSQEESIVVETTESGTTIIAPVITPTEAPYPVALVPIDAPKVEVDTSEDTKTESVPPPLSLLENTDVQKLLKNNKSPAFRSFIETLNNKISQEEQENFVAKLTPKAQKEKDVLLQAIREIHQAPTPEEIEKDTQIADKASKAFEEEQAANTEQKPETDAPKSEGQQEVDARVAKAKDFFRKNYNLKELDISLLAIRSLLADEQAKKDAAETQAKVDAAKEKENAANAAAQPETQKPSLFARLKDKVTGLLSNIKNLGHKTKETVIIGPIVRTQNKVALRSIKKAKAEQKGKTSNSRNFWIGLGIGALAAIGLEAYEYVHHAGGLYEVINTHSSTANQIIPPSQSTHSAIQTGSQIGSHFTDSSITSTAHSLPTHANTLTVDTSISHLHSTTEAAIAASFPGAEMEQVHRHWDTIPGLSTSAMHIDSVGQNYQLRVSPELHSAAQHIMNSSEPTQFLINLDHNQTEVVTVPAGAHFSTLVHPGGALYEVLKNGTFKTIEYGQKVGNTFHIFSTALGKAA